MRNRFLGIAARGRMPDETLASMSGSLLDMPSRFQLVVRTEWAKVTVEGAVPLLLDRQHGAIIGALYRRGRTNAVSELGRADQDLIRTSRGAHLIDAYWGGYLAVIVDPGTDRIDLIRAPLGDLPCYYCIRDDAIAFASDVPLLIAAGLFKPNIDLPALARHLVAEDIRTEETCLRGLRELPGGQRLSIDRTGIATTPLWSPWTYADPARRIADPEDARRRIRSAAIHCVGAATSTFDKVALKLSGGLDSSIVAACLSEASRDFTCVTLVTHNPSGDERAYARAASARLGVPLTERLREIERVDIARSAGMNLPRPIERSFAQASRSLMDEEADACGAGAIIDGAGGDNIFCSMKSVRPVIDCLRSDVGRSHYQATVRNVARLADVSALTVAWRAWRAARRRTARYPFPRDDRFLSGAAKDMARAAIDHPWLDAPPGALPGKAAHVALVMTAQSVAEGFDPIERLPDLSPLISQPLVEVCLQVPSWEWFDDGNDRAAARHAFADLLPKEIVWRRSKGSPDSFIIELYDANRATIRDLLLNGRLAEFGLLDRDALARTIDDPRPVTGHDFYRVMRLVDIEVWARAT